MAEEYSGMTVNERLAAARLSDHYESAVANGDLAAINQVLAKIGLRQDDNGMNWSVANDA